MGCSATKQGCASMKAKPSLKKWDDNRALREAGMQELTREQLNAFDIYWQQYMKDIFSMNQEDQSALEWKIEERKENPDKAEEWRN